MAKKAHIMNKVTGAKKTKKAKVSRGAGDKPITPAAAASSLLMMNAPVVSSSAVVDKSPALVKSDAAQLPLAVAVPVTSDTLAKPADVASLSANPLLHAATAATTAASANDFTVQDYLEELRRQEQERLQLELLLAEQERRRQLQLQLELQQQQQQQEQERLALYRQLMVRQALASNSSALNYAAAPVQQQQEDPLALYRQLAAARPAAALDPIVQAPPREDNLLLRTQMYRQLLLQQQQQQEEADLLNNGHASLYY